MLSPRGLALPCWLHRWPSRGEGGGLFYYSLPLLLLLLLLLLMPCICWFAVFTCSLIPTARVESSRVAFTTHTPTSHARFPQTCLGQRVCAWAGVQVCSLMISRDPLQSRHRDSCIPCLRSSSQCSHSLTQSRVESSLASSSTQVESLVTDER